MLELPGKLLPKSTRPWRIAILRRHQPAEAVRFQDFRPCLRWEFGFSCAFCLLHEADLSEHGTEGWGLMWTEHRAPRSRAPESAHEYENCFYSCRFCNEARGARPVIDHAGRRLLDPCEGAWQESFELDGDEIRVVGNDPNAAYTHEAYDLNDRRKVRMRRKRRLVLSERLDLYTQTAALQDRLLQRALDTGDPTWVVDAQIAWENFQAAGEDLLRFVPIPADADQRCACGEARHHTLPQVLEEQLLSFGSKA